MMHAQLQQQPSDGAPSQPSVPSPHLGPMRNQAGESDNPYVRSHADTPVHWQLLNAATLQRAEDENKPIFMHIGFHADHRESIYFSIQSFVASVVGL